MANFLKIIKRVYPSIWNLRVRLKDNFSLFYWTDSKINWSEINCPFKDLMVATFWFLYFNCLTQFISLFIPPTIKSYNIAYWVSYVIIFLMHFHSISLLMLLYKNYVYIFKPDEFDENTSTLRLKTFIWKLILTVIAISIGIACPSKVVPVSFRMWSKGKSYERYVNKILKNSNSIVHVHFHTVI